MRQTIIFQKFHNFNVFREYFVNSYFHPRHHQKDMICLLVVFVRSRNIQFLNFQIYSKFNCILHGPGYECCCRHWNAHEFRRRTMKYKISYWIIRNDLALSYWWSGAYYHNTCIKCRVTICCIILSISAYSVYALLYVINWSIYYLFKKAMLLCNCFLKRNIFGCCKCFWFFVTVLFYLSRILLLGTPYFNWCCHALIIVISLWYALFCNCLKMFWAKYMYFLW